MTKQKESARQMRSRRLTCRTIKLAQYPKPLRSEAELASTSWSRRVQGLSSKGVYIV
jgi:hypothetical protein